MLFKTGGLPPTYSFDGSYFPLGLNMILFDLIFTEKYKIKT